MKKFSVSLSNSQSTGRLPLRGSNLRKLTVLAAGVLLLLGINSARATDYTWASATAGGSWTTATNWSPNTGFPSTASDTATLNNATASRTVTLNAAESISTLTFNQSTASVTNELELEGDGSTTTPTDLTVANALTVGNGSTTAGTEYLFIDEDEYTGTGSGGNSALKGNVIYTGNITLDAGGTVEMAAYTNTYVPEISGAVTISGGTLQIDQSIAGNTDGATITGNLSMTSGAINLQATNSDGLSATGGIRFNIDGVFTASGGKINESGAAVGSYSNQLYLDGSGANFENGVSGTVFTTLTGTLGAPTATATPNTAGGFAYAGNAVGTSGASVFTLAADASVVSGTTYIMPTLFLLPSTETNSVVNVTVQAYTPGGTYYGSGIDFGPGYNGSNVRHEGALEMTAGSNIYLYGNITPAYSVAAGSLEIINTNGYTVDQSEYMGAFTDGSTGGNNVVIDGGGALKAQFFVINGLPAGTGTTFGSSVAGATTLISTGYSGGSSSADVNNLGAGTGGGIIDPTSTFQYTGTVAGSSDENYLTSNREIGRLEVGNGSQTTTLGIASSTFGSATSTLGVGGDINVMTNANLDMAGQNITEAHEAANSLGSASTEGGVINFAASANGGLTGAGTILDSTASTISTLTLDTTASSATFSGKIENNGGSGGTVALTILGNGNGNSQTISGTSNTYTGGTIVGSTSTASGLTAATATASNLNLTGSLAAGGALGVGQYSTVAIGVAGGGTTYRTQTVASLNLYSGGAFTSGAAGTTAQPTLAFAINAAGTNNDELKVTSGGAFMLNGTSGDTFAVQVTGAPIYSGNTLMTWSDSDTNVNSLNSIDYILNGVNEGTDSSLLTLTDMSGTWTLQAVPEPSTWALIFLGFGSLVYFQRRRIQELQAEQD